MCDLRQRMNCQQLRHAVAIELQPRDAKRDLVARLHRDAAVGTVAETDKLGFFARTPGALITNEAMSRLRDSPRRQGRSRAPRRRGQCPGR